MTRMADGMQGIFERKILQPLIVGILEKGDPVSPMDKVGAHCTDNEGPARTSCSS